MVKGKEKREKSKEAKFGMKCHWRMNRKRERERERKEPCKACSFEAL